MQYGGSSNPTLKGGIDDRPVEAVPACAVGFADEHAKKNTITSWFHSAPR
jgi:hypothetical protein